MIELSIMEHGPIFDEELRSLVTRFEAEYNCPVQIQALPWRGAWSEFVRIALYKHGPDVSEVGNTWVSEFVSMNALRPFTGAETAHMGGPSEFLAPAWQSGILAGHPQSRSMVWAIPWLADVRILCYRRDLLERAGVDPESAFGNVKALAQTLARLQAAGIPMPWVVPTRRSRMTLHNIAHWVWGAGGDFLTPDMRRTAFNKAEARAGMRAYFELARFLSPGARGLEETDSDARFISGKAAVTISGPWLLKVPSEYTAFYGQTLPPGTPFVGGSHLAIWKHTRQAEKAVELVRFLSSETAQTALFNRFGLFPTRLDVLNSDVFASDPFHRQVAEGLKAGRTFPPFTLWGLVETRLTAALADIWADILAKPEPDIDAILDRHLGPTAQRLDVTLSDAS